MATYTTLDQGAEDGLHVGRLLSTEDKQLKRLSKKLVAVESLVARPNLPKKTTASHSSVSADANDAESTIEGKGMLAVDAEWEGETVLELTSFESHVARTQFLLISNSKERDRYALEKNRVIETASAVRSGNDQLKNDLGEAQSTLALRKTFDELAEKITKNDMLKTRDEQRASIQRLHDEIAELGREGEDLGAAWMKRQTQFQTIAEAYARLRRIIRDEDEADSEDDESTENEDEDEEREEDPDAEEHTEKGEDEDAVARGAPTPAPDAVPFPTAANIEGEDNEPGHNIDESIVTAPGDEVMAEASTIGTEKVEKGEAEQMDTS